MDNSTLQITFLRDAIDSEYIEFLIRDLDTGNIVSTVYEVFIDGIRQNLNTVPTTITEAPATLPASETAYNYIESLKLDYGNLFTYQQSGNTVTLGIYDSTKRYAFESVDATDGLIDYVGDNVAPNPLTIISETLVPFSCVFYSLEIATSELATYITVNGVILPNSDNPAIVLLAKDIENNVSLQDASGNSVNSTYTPTFYNQLAADNLGVEVVFSLAGATVTILSENVDNLELQYSIDNVNWRTENVFSGVAVGDYTMYVKDQLSCEVSFLFSVTEAGTRDPIAYISKANSFNFVLIEETSSCDTPRNDENTFAVENVAKLPSCTETLLQNCDTITTQIKSNFDTVEATLVKEEYVPAQPATEGNENLLYWSNDFAHLEHWSRYGLDIDTDGIYLISQSLGGIVTNHYIRQDIAKTPTAEIYTVSGKFKMDSFINGVWLRLYNDNDGAYLRIDLRDGTFTFYENGDFASIDGGVDDLGDGWYFCWLTSYSDLGTAVALDITLTLNGSQNFQGNDVSGIFASEVQLKRGELNDYIETTDEPIIIPEQEAQPAKDYSETEILVSKMSENLNRFQSMDCTMYDFGTGQAGVYFTSGFLYDDNWVQTEDTYALNGNLPDFAKIGNTISLQGRGTFEIVSILFDDRVSVRKKVIVVNYNYTGEVSDEVVACLYDVLPYDIYQFTVDWSSQDAGTYYVSADFTDETNEPIKYFTEPIIIAEEHAETVRIDYYNSNNRDIFYKYGIEHRLRVPLLSIQAVSNEEQEINLTDNGAYVVDSLIYEADIITFDDMVKSLLRKVTIATGSEFVFINGVGYAGNASLEFEPLGMTNLYSASKQMVKTNVAYSTRHTQNTGLDTGYIPFDIPPLLSTGEGFLKI